MRKAGDDARFRIRPNKRNRVDDTELEECQFCHETTFARALITCTNTDCDRMLCARCYEGPLCIDCVEDFRTECECGFQFFGPMPTVRCDECGMTDACPKCFDCSYVDVTTGEYVQRCENCIHPTELPTRLIHISKSEAIEMVEGTLPDEVCGRINKLRLEMKRAVVPLCDADDVKLDEDERIDVHGNNACFEPPECEE